MASVSTSEVLVSDLPTKSVTLTPVRATVVREIKAVVQPGPNELSILGIDPRVDVDSIRLEGSGPATITDIQTQTTARRQTFDDAHPEQSDSDDSSTSDDDDDAASLASDDYDSDADTELRSVRDEMTHVETRLARARNKKLSALSTLEFLDGYGRSLRPEHADTEQVERFIRLFESRRSDGSERHREASLEEAEAEKAHQKLIRRRARLESKHQKKREAALAAVRKRRQQRQREREQKKQLRLRTRRDLRLFWTHNMAEVVVHLDGHGVVTPASSRRSSVVGERPASLERMGSGTGSNEAGAGAGAGAEVTLRLTYVVPLASWSPRYELSINTPTSSARMIYRAQFHNSSTETWKDTRVTLSTSQASFSGLGEQIPTLRAWHIKLDPTQRENKDQPSWNRILNHVHVRDGVPLPVIDPPNNNAALQDWQMKLMLLEQQNKCRMLVNRQPTDQQQQQQAQQQAQQQQQQQQQAQQQAQAIRPTGSLFGSLASAPPQQPPPQIQPHQYGTPHHQMTQQAMPMPQQMTQQAMGMPPPPPTRNPFNDLGAGAGEEDDDDDANSESPTISAAAANLEHQDSVRQDYGLTTTYDLPGRRTLAPSSNNRRHVLADLDLRTVSLQHIIVPKHRAAAFLRARIKNTSTVQMLSGRVGVTVDGTFLGTTGLPACAPNDAFTVTMGVDPSVQVTYEKPSVQRTAAGFFAKEDAAVFRRGCWVKNAKSAPVNVVVLDQVPLAEDERMKVVVLRPRGLEKEGDQVVAEVEREKGEGSVRLEKNGRVRWVMRLLPGKEVKLALEYEARVPSGCEVEAA